MVEKQPTTQVIDSPLEPSEIALRTFAVPVKKKKDKDEKPDEDNWKPLPPSDWYLIFDTETFTDPAQQIRIGTYQVRQSNALYSQGFFYDPKSLTEEELYILHDFVGSQDEELDVKTLKEFIEEIFFLFLYDLGGTCIGFNLGFDLSRLASSHAPARRKMQGGFSFTLGEDPRRPRVQVKHLNPKASKFQFSVPEGRNPEKRNREKSGKSANRRGYFIDVKSLGAALLGRSDSLESLTGFLQTEHQKVGTDEHGKKIASHYLKYALNDVQATWECFDILRAKFDALAFTQTPISRILSEASLGKANLREMGIVPWQKVQPDFPPGFLGTILSTYGGGRSEVHLRREIAQTLHCDFLSMYPSVCVLMGLWDFVIAKGIAWDDTTEKTRKDLETITSDKLQNPETWKKLLTIVQIQPDGDWLPVRAPYGKNRSASSEEAHLKTSLTLGINYLTSPWPLWFTLADCIASKIKTGKAPKVLKAFSFRPVGRQEDLKPIFLVGNQSYRIDPYKDDFYKQLIDLRNDVKKRKDEAIKNGNAELAEQLDAEQNLLKIIANATSYGIFMELNVTQYEKPRRAICYDVNGIPFEKRVRNIEKPGEYFHPLLSTLITGAARLMLMLAQALCENNGLDWIFCDTDSLAITPKNEMEFEQLIERVEKVREWFVPLNPYAKQESLLKLEDVNRGLENEGLAETLEPLYAFAVSSKRYSLFNLKNGEIVIRKASASALGHLIPPYEEGESPCNIPPPQMPLEKIGVERWQYDLWYRIVEAAIKGHPNQVKLDDLPGFSKRAVSRYAASTPKLLSWFDKYNEGKSYRGQVRPFGFMLSFFADKKLLPHDNDESEKTKDDFPKPVAAFDKNTEKATEKCFNRQTGEPIPKSGLKTNRRVLAQYHLHPEDKFLNADYLDSGFTAPRHILATELQYIGKEANKWHEQFYTGADPEGPVWYGPSPQGHQASDDISSGDLISQRRLAKDSKISRDTLSRLRRGQRLKAKTIAKVHHTQSRLTIEANEEAENIRQLLEKVSVCCAEIGLRQFAKKAEVDAGNISNILRGKRRPSQGDIAKLEKFCTVFIGS